MALLRSTVVVLEVGWVACMPLSNVDLPTLDDAARKFRERQLVKLAAQGEGHTALLRRILESGLVEMPRSGDGVESEVNVW